MEDTFGGEMFQFNIPVQASLRNWFNLLLNTIFILLYITLHSKTILVPAIALRAAMHIRKELQSEQQDESDAETKAKTGIQVVSNSVGVI